ncbi:hypothetical protein [Nonomuraea sp. NPDC049758]|uniref:hypothetical protein n=1 Tax=Nonomuraea sp. NPDC049758 TaxID=3154360 RepID=UPI0034312CE9
MRSEEWRPGHTPAEINTRWKAGAVEGLELSAEHVLQASRQRVPLEFGDLERSGATSVDRSELRAAVSYGTPYAVYQHETPGLNHLPGREWKYLENPAREEAEVIERIIAAAIERALS